MGIPDELKKMGYRFDYDHGDSEDRTEVWINQEAGRAVRIEWMRIDADGWRVDQVRRLHGHGNRDRQGDEDGSR